MLNAAGWFGSLIHDADGDLFAVDLGGGTAIEYLGRADEVMFDMAFSPSGELYGIGGPPQGPSELYTIQVDLQDPTDTVTTTLVDVVRLEGGGTVFANGLEFRDDGLLFAAGYDSFGERSVFRIDPSTADAEAEASLGDYASAGDLTFDTDGTMYVTTLSGDLLWINRALSTGGVVGWTGVGDFYGLTYGPAPIMHGFRHLAPVVYRINRLDATAVAIATLEHPLLSGINGAATVFEPPTDLGTVDFLVLPDQQPILGELWYRVEPFRDGILTADLPDAGPPDPDVQLTLFTQDAGGELHEVASGQGRVDYDEAVAGQEYFLRVDAAPAGVEIRLTNLVVPTSGGAIVYGTEQDDLFELVASAEAATELSINGVAYQFDFSSLATASVAFHGGPGADAALLSGSEAAEVAELWPDSGSLRGPGYLVEVDGTVEIAFEGGGGDDRAMLSGSGAAETATFWPRTAELGAAGHMLTAIDVGRIEVSALGGRDTATFLGSGGDETVQLLPESAEFAGDAFHSQAWDFESVTAYGEGGSDRATLWGSVRNDSLVGSPVYASLGGHGFELTAWDFATVHVHGGGGLDVAKLYDSPGHDTLVLARGYANMFGEGFSFQAGNFDGLHVFATADGFDVAKFYDSPQDDTFYASAVEAALYGTDFYNRAKFFEQVHAYATAGGLDTAHLYDSTEDDTFYASPTEAALYADGFYNRAKFFERVHGYSDHGGHDRALLYDSAGHDTLVATPSYAALSGPQFDTRSYRFEEVDAYATGGGFDMAKLFDSVGNDQFVATPTYGALVGQDFGNRARHFEQVHAYATGGGLDVAKLFDSPADDTFRATAKQAALFSASYYNRAKHFEQVHAYATAGGSDTADMSGSSADDSFYADPIQTSLYGGGFYNRAKHFEQVYAEAGEGNDRADFYDSSQPDLLEARDDWARLSNAALDFLYRVGGFDHVRATASSSDDAAVVDWESLSFTLQLDGPWS